MSFKQEEIDKLILEVLEETKLTERGLSGYDKKSLSYYPATRSGDQAESLHWLIGWPKDDEGGENVTKIFKTLGSAQRKTLVNLAKQWGAQRGRDAQVIKDDDFKAMLSNRDHPEHAAIANWVNLMHRNSSAWKGSLEKLTNLTPSQQTALQNHIDILRVTGELSAVMASPDPEDKELGATSPTPEFPIKGTYATTTGRARTPLTFVKMFNNILAGKTNLKLRFEKLEQIAESIKTGSAAPGVGFQEQISGVYVYDILRSVVQDYEAGGAGGLFENFLAMLANGTVEGGNRKIDDFYIGADLDSMLQMASDSKAGQPGSAKLLAAGNKYFKGSDTLFNNYFKINPNGKILYVVALKGTKLEKITVYFHEIKKDTLFEPSSDGTDRLYTIGYAGRAGKVEIDLSPFTKTGPNYEDNVKTVLNKALTNIGSVNQLVNTARASLVRMSTAKTLKDRQDSAVTAMTAYNKLTIIVDPVGEATKSSTPAPAKLATQMDLAKKRAAISENNTKTLDKLIEEVILREYMED